MWDSIASLPLDVDFQPSASGKYLPVRPKKALARKKNF
jgi:hypothetical protein